MRRWLFVLLFGCGSDSKDPADVTAADLYGQWSHESAPGQFQILTFQPRARFHPDIADRSDVYIEYTVQQDVQIPKQIGSFTVDAGTITEQQIFDDFQLTHAPGNIPVDIVAYSTSELTTANVRGETETFRRVQRCELPTAREGGRTYDSAHATYLRQGTQGELMSAAIAPDGSLLLTGNAVSLRYDTDCVPEVDGVVTEAGSILLVETADGVHRIGGVGGAAATYELVPAGALRGTSRPLPVAGTSILGAADADGAVAILAQGNQVVRDDGATFSTTTISGSGVPLDFTARAIAHLGGGKLAFAGDARNVANGTTSPFLVEETAGGFTAEAIPAPAGGTAEYSLAVDGDDRWLIFTNGSVNGGNNQQHLARRRSGTWATQVLTMGGAMTVRAQGGIGHLAGGVVKNSGLEIKPTYTRVDGDTITQWALARAGSAVGLAQARGLPAGLALKDDVAYVGFNGILYERRADDLTTLGTAKVTFQISGSGRVTSLDGLVDCTSTCTVTAPVGQRLLVRTEPPTATFNGVEFPIPGAADIEVAQLNIFNPQAFEDLTVQVQF